MGDRRDRDDREAPPAQGYVDVPLIEDEGHMVQGTLFPLEEIQRPVRGYRGTVACSVAGITYRQLDYWARKRIIVPSIKPSHGSGSRRLYSFKDILIMAVAKKLLDIGINLQNVTNAVEYFMEQDEDSLSHQTVVCDGQHVTECARGDEMVRMLEDGEAVFGVSVAAIWKRVSEACDRAEYFLMEDMSTTANRPIDDLAEQHMKRTLEKRKVLHEHLLRDAGEARQPTIDDVNDEDNGDDHDDGDGATGKPRKPGTPGKPGKPKDSDDPGEADGGEDRDDPDRPDGDHA